MLCFPNEAFSFFFDSTQHSSSCFPVFLTFFFLMASCFCLPPPEKETKLANRYNSAIMAPHSVRRSERTNHARLYFVSCLFRGYFYGQHFLLVVVVEMPWAWWIATERRSNSHRDGEIYRPCRWCTGPRSLFSLRALLLLLNIFIAVENGVNDVGEEEEEEEPQKARRRILDTQEEERSP